MQKIVEKIPGHDSEIYGVGADSIITAVTTAVPSSGEIVIVDKNFKVLGTIQTD